MKILFVIADIFLSEPIGLMQLSAICKKNNHSTKLITLKRHSILKTIAEFQPDIIGYSTMSPDVNSFIESDLLARTWIKNNNKHIIRIMGGPHPTYFPDILLKCDLDGICVGEGDNAILNIVNNIQQGKDLSDIPNVLCKTNYNLGGYKKELINDLDSLPFVDREIIFDAIPYYRLIRLRSFLTQRGCPYNCTYCHNHAFNSMFRGHGSVLRRRSVDGVIDEIKYVVKKYSPVKLIRFGDDTFAHKIDNWLVNFLYRYKKEIGLPFYCLMRSNTLTEDMAKILSEAGCHSVGMSVETGDENVRNNILKRHLSNETIIKSFEYARKYNIKTFGNTMFGIPGTTLKHDFDSFKFTKKLKMSIPTFGIFCPYPGTELTEYAMAKGLLDKNAELESKYSFTSELNCYTKQEKNIQLRMAYLSPIFCSLPNFFVPLFKILVRINLTWVYSVIGSGYVIYKTSTKIFPRIYPVNPIVFFKILKDSMNFTNPKEEDKKISAEVVD